MKTYTDIEQSRKLAEFLPLESADGFWDYHEYWYSEGDEWEGYEDYPRAEPYLEKNAELLRKGISIGDIIPGLCLSISFMDVLGNYIVEKKY